MKSRNESKAENPVFQSRLIFVYLGVLVWGILVFARLIWLQAVQNEHYLDLARNQQQGFSEVPGVRGQIKDRNLSELAITVQVNSLTADPSLVQDPEAAARTLSAALGKDASELLRALERETRFVRLVPRLMPSQTAQIRSLQLKGIYVDDVSQRFYPAQDLASSVMGFVGTDDDGLSGLEYLYDDQLQGKPQRVYYDFDGRRRRVERVSESIENKGGVLVLNLDRSIQFIAEQALAKAVKTTQASNGTAIVMDPATGEILAMASFPTFDPNRFSDYGDDEYRNRGILQIYEPGSTFKIITLSAVLNEGLAELGEVIDCRVGSLRLAGKTYREAKHSFEDLSVREIVAKSSNVGTIKLALRLGEERFFEYITRFGFGAKSGVDLPGEQAGLLRDVKHWSKISIGAHAIGQELGVTPLQIVRAVAAIANGGILVQPQVVRRMHSASGDLLLENRAQGNRILRESTARLMREALGLVVEEGTGSLARLDGYSSGGKTGTAQKFIGGHYSKTRYVASYVGFAPLSNPRLATVVVIDEPLKGLYYGGHVAGPAFKQIMEHALLYLNVPQDRPGPVRLARERSPRREPGKKSGVSMEEEDLLTKEYLEKTVLSLIDARREVSDSGVITLDTGLTTIPDFTGKSLREVAREAVQQGLKVRVSGSGVAVGQLPQPGSQVKTGAVCEVFFSSQGVTESASRTIVAEGSTAANRRSPRDEF